MYERLIETISNNQLSDGCYIDAWNRIVRWDGLSGTIHTKIFTGNYFYVAVENEPPKLTRICGLLDTEDRLRSAYAIYDKNGLAPTIDTMQGGGRQPFIIEDDDNGI